MRRRTRVALIAGLILALGPAAVPSRTDPPGFMGDFRWTKDDPLFGGWSGLEVSADGSHIYALSDRGAWIEGDIRRDATGHIVGVISDDVHPLHGIGSGPLPPDSRDSEGFAIARDGTAYVSFEGPARVMRYPEMGGPGTLLPSAPEFPTMDPNGSLESLAVDAEGTIYTLPEVTIRDDDFFPVFRFRNGVWDQPWLIPIQGSFYVSDAKFGPDGRFYILEREFRGLSGFASRLRRFELGDLREPHGETVFTSEPGRFGNLEGVSIWREPDGHMRATMISDDNFLDILGTELVEIRLPD